MDIDLKIGPRRWSEVMPMAGALEAAGFSGMLFTEQNQSPWMAIAVAAVAAPSLEFSTGIAVAFPRSPYLAASMTWELAENTQGRFRLGLGTGARTEIQQQRYGMPFDHPGPRLKDYVGAVRACFRAFRGEDPLGYDGPYYKLANLPPMWAPRRHEYGDVKIDVSAVGPWMCQMAGEVADGIHVHPFHSLHYVHNRLLPEVAAGCDRAGRAIGDVRLTVPVFAVPGDTPAERAEMLEKVRSQIAYYGSNLNYAFQLDDLGYEGLALQLNSLLQKGQIGAMNAAITEEILEHFAVIAPWDGMAGALIERYGKVASRLVLFMGEESIEADPENLEKWGAVARSLREPTPED